MLVYSIKRMGKIYKAAIIDTHKYQCICGYISSEYNSKKAYDRMKKLHHKFCKFGENDTLQKFQDVNMRTNKIIQSGML